MSQTPPAKSNVPRLGETISAKDLPASAPKPSANRTTPEHLPEEFGRYRILKKLGEGGMGAVYLARDTQLDRQVALKVPTFGPAASTQQLERFFREAKAAAAFDHPNLCPVYDAGTINGTHYLTMPFIEGKALADFIKSDKPLALQQAAKIVRKIALAVAEAHKRGVVHRDLKPANVMINKRGEPVVMDFGLARMDTGEAARLTGAGAILGTPSYMAPEQVKGEQDKVGPACDIYALGVILYELVSGRRPFQGPATAVLCQILFDPPPPLASVRPDVDAKLAAICHRALAKEQGERHASMEDFARSLTDYLTGAPAKSGPPSGLYPPPLPVAPSAATSTAAGASAPRWAWFSKRRLMTAVAALALLAGISIWAGSRGLPPDDGAKTGDAPVAVTPTPPEQPIANSLPDPADWKPGPAEDGLPGLIPRPAKLPGIRRWQAETVVFRGEITALAWQPGGDLVACGTSLGDIRLYESRTFRLAGLLLGHKDALTAIGWSPDGKRLASTSEDRSVRLWQADGTPGPVLWHKAATNAVAWGPGGKQLATAGRDSYVRLWDADGTPGPLIATPVEPGTSVAWDPDGRWLALGGDKLRLWKPDGSPGPVLHDGIVRAVAWSPDGKWLASAGQDNVVRLWDADGKPGHVLKGKGHVSIGLAWSADGKRLASGGERSVRTWSADGVEGPVIGVGYETTAVAINGDGKRVAASCVRTLQVSDTGATPEHQVLRSTGPVNSVAWSPDGKRLATANYAAVRLWGTDTVPVPAPWPEQNHVFSAAWRPDGKRLGFGAYQLWQMDGRPGAEPKVDVVPQTNFVSRSAWRHDGKRVALVIWDGGVRLMNVEEAPVMLPEVVTTGATDVAWSPTAPKLATAHFDGVVRLWDGEGLPGTVLKHTQGVWCLAWSRDGKRLASGSTDGTVRLWEADGTPGPVLKGFNQNFYSVTWSPNGDRLATSDAGTDRAVRLWKSDGTPIATLKGHAAHVMSVAWAPAGDLIAAGGQDHRTVLWDAARSEPVAVTVPLRGEGAVSFTAAGRLIPKYTGAFNDDLVYVVEQASGRLELLKPSEFLKRAAVAEPPKQE